MGLALLVVGGLWFSRSAGSFSADGGKSAGRSAVRNILGDDASSASDPIANAPRQVAAVEEERPPGEFDMASFMERLSQAQSPEQMRKFIAKHGESVENLVLASRYCGEREFLDRARELYPTDPRVLFGIAKSPSYTEDERLAAAEALQKSVPLDANGYLAAAHLHFKKNDGPAALELMRRALEAEYEGSYGDTLLESAKQALMMGGYSAVEAEFGALVSTGSERVRWFGEITTGLAHLHAARVKEGDPAGAAEIAQIGTRYAQMLRKENDGSMLTALLGDSTEHRMLNLLPVEIHTAADRQLELLAEINQMKKLGSQVEERMQQSLSAKEFKEYVYIHGEQGEIAAAQWLLKKSAPASK